MVKRKLFNKRSRVTFSGNYDLWEDALQDSIGYSDDEIIQKVRNSSLKVKNDEAVYERDSVLFDKIQYSWPLLAALLRVATLNNHKLHVMDFGGALGSSYYQNRKFLNHINDFKWCVIEQEKFYAIGKKEFEDDCLKFYSNIKECHEKNEIDVILLSCVLPYLENPYQILNELINLGVKNIIIDRHPILTNSNKDIITVQNVPENIYKASYPAWLFNESKFKSVIKKKYNIFEEISGNDKVDYPCNFKCYILTVKHEN
jgi:putative methyltransferase (TIGR04325 family)